MKVRDIIKLVEGDGWQLGRTQGNQRQFKHSDKSGVVTISGHPSVDIPSGNLNSILKQAGLKDKNDTQWASSTRGAEP